MRCRTATTFRCLTTRTRSLLITRRTLSRSREKPQRKLLKRLRRRLRERQRRQLLKKLPKPLLPHRPN